MKLNHDIYEEAMENVKLSDERGLKLIEQAMHQRQQRGQRRKLQVAAVVAAILTVALSLNGICYAQTGKNALEMFTVLFGNENVEEMAELMDGARESGESVVSDNLKFTLECYWYDQENGEAIYTMRIDSMDGSPLDIEKINQEYIIMDRRWTGGYSYDSESNKDKTSYKQYCYVEGVLDQSGNPVDKINIEVCKYEDDCPAIGGFTLEPTGKMKARYVDFSFLKECSSKAKITGTGWTVRFDHKWLEYEEPFDTVDIVMKDGTVYRSGFHPTPQVLPIYNADGEVLNEEELEGEPSEEQLIYCGYSSINDNFPGKEGIWGVCHVSFRNYINVDDIEAVYMDGVELQLE